MCEANIVGYKQFIENVDIIELVILEVIVFKRDSDLLNEF